MFAGPSDVEGGVVVVIEGIDIGSSLDRKQNVVEAASRSSSEQADVRFLVYFANVVLC